MKTWGEINQENITKKEKKKLFSGYCDVIIAKRKNHRYNECY